MKSPRRVFFLLSVAALVLPGCAARQTVAPPVPVSLTGDTGTPAVQPAPVPPPGCDAGKTTMPVKQAVSETNPPGSGVAAADAADKAAKGTEKLQQLVSVYFPYGLATLDDTARQSLERVYQAMARGSASLRLEGYCDERGSDEYNLALGQARAQGAKNWLESRGMAAGRLSTVSYGLDYPADPGTTDAAYARNRRVEIYYAEAPGPDQRRRSSATSH